MKSIRSFFVTLCGLTFVAVLSLFTASVGIAIFGALAVLALGQWLSLMIASGAAERPAPVYARSRASRREDELRVWNDGKGTIIDM